MRKLVFVIVLLLTAMPLLSATKLTPEQAAKKIKTDLKKSGFNTDVRVEQIERHGDTFLDFKVVDLGGMEFLGEMRIVLLVAVVASNVGEIASQARWKNSKVFLYGKDGSCVWATATDCRKCYEMKKRNEKMKKQNPETIKKNFGELETCYTSIWNKSENTPPVKEDHRTCINRCEKNFGNHCNCEKRSYDCQQRAANDCRNDSNACDELNKCGDEFERCWDKCYKDISACVNACNN